MRSSFAELHGEHTNTLSGDHPDASRFFKSRMPDPQQILKVRNPTKTEPLRYSMTIQWSEEDHVYIVTVPELPGCKTHGKTYVEAVKQGQDAIESWIE